MIGGGGRIGKPPGGTPEAPAPSDKPAPSSAAPKASATRDGFEKTSLPKAPEARAPTPGGLAKEGATLADILKVAHDNPKAAAQVAQGLAAQVKTTLGEIEREAVAAQQLVAELARERFSKAARDKAGQELVRRRRGLESLKQRYQATARRLALLEQLAGCVSDPRLHEELDKLTRDHQKLRTDWGRRHHLLALGELLFGAADDAPEYLREVVRAQMTPRGSEVTVNLMQELSPQRLIAEMLARTLDGTTRQPAPTSGDALLGEHGVALRDYATLAGLLDGAVAADPFAEEDES